jgi:hypothetical protein
VKDNLWGTDEHMDDRTKRNNMHTFRVSIGKMNKNDGKKNPFQDDFVQLRLQMRDELQIFFTATSDPEIMCSYTSRSN